MLEPKDIERYERELRAMVRRAGDEDPEGFTIIASLLAQAYRALPHAAAMMRERGYSWADIARPAGVSRQAAWDRFSRGGDVHTDPVLAITESIRRPVLAGDHDG